MNENFLCECGHRNKMHSSREDALKGYNIDGRICFEYKNYSDRLKGVEDSWNDETICTCRDFTPDNLKTLELLSNAK